ncbi:MAG: EMC3/TMCO1 family protein [Candidatus Altiarchaeota archaeon]
MPLFELTPAAYEIAVITLFLSAFSIFVRTKVMDMEKYRENQKKMKENQKLLKEAQKNKDIKKMQKAQEDMMKHMSANMKESYKPMVFTLIPFIIIYSWMGAHYGDIGGIHNATIVDGLPGNLSFENVSTQVIWEQKGYREKIYELFMGGNPPEILVKGEWDAVNNVFIWHVTNIRNYQVQTLNLDVNLKDAAIPDINPEINSIEYIIIKDYSAFGGVKSEKSTEVSREPLEGALSYEKIIPEFTEPVIEFSYDIDFTNHEEYAISSWFGYKRGWLGTYFITFMIFSIPMGKIFKTM